MAWPHNPETWPGAFDAIPGLFERLVREVARFEPVWLLAGSPLAERQARERFANVDQVVIFDIRTNDVWTRDYGPTFVLCRAVDGSSDAETAVAVDWTYNGWGEKYPPFDRDAVVARSFAEQIGLSVRGTPIVVEGGAIEGNGDGVVLTTKSCLLNPNRNPDVSLPQITQLFEEQLGARNVVWLHGGDFRGDDTDGHIDQLARFTSERTIVHATCHREDANRPTLERLEQELQEQLPNCDRIGLTVPTIHHESHRLPASYCNFYIVNGGVLVPTFGVAEDDHALGVLREQFPDREVVPFNCRDLVWGLGAIHCMTQQVTG